MGPFHGKLVVHRPSGTVGIAKSRRNPLAPTELDCWDYSLRCANRSVTPFFPQQELRLANPTQKARFQESRQRIASYRRPRRPQIHKHPIGSPRPPRQGFGSNAGQPVGRTKSTETAADSQASSSAALAARLLRDFSKA